MRFDLKTPCKDCPFRTNIRSYLHPERAYEIATYALEGEQGWLERHWLFRLAIILRLFFPKKLNMKAPVFSSRDDMVAATRKEQAHAH